MRLHIYSFLFAILFLSACSHSPKRTQTEELGALRDQLQATIVKTLSSRPGVEKVTSVEILNAEETDGVAKISYKAAYDSRTPETGLVSHEVQAEVALIRGAERNWTVTRIQPQTQSVEFQDAAEVVVKKRK